MNCAGQPIMFTVNNNLIRRLPSATVVRRRMAMLLIGLWPASFATAQVAVDSEFTAPPSWKLPTDAEVRVQMVSWLDQSKPNDAVRAQVLALWPEKSTDVPAPADNASTSANAATPLLQRAVTTFAMVDPNAKEVVEFAARSHADGKALELPVLTDEKTPALVRNNLRLWLGESFAQQRLYDEALQQLKDLQPTDVVDPAALLFYQGVCNHWMLHKEDGLKAINRLLEQKQNIPHRYQEVAELMQADLNELEDDSLDHISRRMNDVTRRLDLGHAGKKVRGEEDGIISSLDKKIKQLEDQANAAGSSGNSGGDSQPGGEGGQGDPQGIRSRNPAADSRLAKGKGPGEVKSKNIGNHSGWGDLPPKEREEAMQQISKDFPSHYRDVIEQYFRRLATEDQEQK
jgi:hypothetical protein